MERIKLDPRHRDVLIVKCGPLGERRFGAWHMAYSGLSTFVDRLIRSLYSVPEYRKAEEVRRLEQQIYGMAPRGHSLKAN
jgi:hypothetical protein